MLAALLVAVAFQQIDSTPPRRAPRTIVVDERLAGDAGIRLGDALVVSRTPGGEGDTVVVSAFMQRRADPSEVARAEYRVRMHLDELQSLIDYGDRVDRFALASTRARRVRLTARFAGSTPRRSAFRRIARATSPSRRRAPFSS